MTDLYAVKHVADRIANEPRNVGVIATAGYSADSSVAVRFLGVDLDGTVARRPLSDVPKEVYLSWVDYFTSKTRAGRWEDIARAHRRRPQDFYLDHILTILDREDVEKIADEYYVRLVKAARKRRASAEPMRQQVDAIFEDLDLAPDRGVSVEATLNGRHVRVSFDYALLGAVPVLLDQLPLRGLQANGQAFAFRTVVAREAGVSRDFAAFIDLNGVTNEEDLHPIESVATVIDPMGDYDEALNAVAAVARL